MGTVSGHIEALRARHSALDTEIEKLQAAPGAEDLELSRLKKEKLDVKDQLETLSRQTA